MNIFFLIGDLIGDLIARPLSIYLISTRTLEESTNGCARGREGGVVVFAKRPALASFVFV